MWVRGLFLGIVYIGRYLFKLFQKAEYANAICKLNLTILSGRHVFVPTNRPINPIS